ncbi:MAG: ABC transporter permease [Anaerolineae bacterium]|jgi:putative spermidine/putrescine transport system permease protein|nr:ABC transporter permease [Anaerolineae bacterium]MDH7473456.1 ABC transporter permease [Anaerolineae bacterium]
MKLIRQYLKAILNARKLLIYTFLLCFVLMIYLPFLMIALKSIGKGWFGRLWLPPELTLDWYRWAIEVTNIPEITKNTLIIAALAVAMSTLIGIPTGWAFGRRHIPGKELLMSIILLPRMIPPIAYALGVAQIFYRLHLVNTHFGVALAHVAICAPYAILVLSATFEGLDERVLEAAAVCGANSLRTFFHVVLPLILPGILSSMIFTFTTSYNEFTLTLMTYGKDTMTLPVRTYIAMGEGYWEVTSAMSIILVIPSIIVLFMIQRQVAPEKLVGGFKGV